MNREKIYYSAIGGGLLCFVLIIVWQVWPDPIEPLDPPGVLAQRLETAPPDQKVKAANDFVRHGEAARSEVRSALSQHQRHEPEVVAPLLQATMKNRDYRSMPTLLDLLEHEDPIVRGRAGAAIQKILGADLGFRANAPDEERTRVIKLIRQDYENGMSRMHEFYSGQRE